MSLTPSSFFDDHNDDFVKGQFNPLELAQTIVDRGKPGFDRVLAEERIYTGRPSSSRQPRSYSANMRQCASWTASGVTCIPRMLRYPNNWPTEKAREKGVDVMLTIDFVAMAIDDAYDVGVLVSRDTDMAPALEYVLQRPKLGKRVEVAAWRSERAKGRLHVPGHSVWCHWLDRSTYDTLADGTDYTQ